MIIGNGPRGVKKERIFTIDLAVRTLLVKQRVLDSFYDGLGEALKNTKSDALGGTEGRSRIYKEAFNTTHHLGPPWMIGKTFSKLCGHDELDLDTITTGSIQFGAVYNGVSDFIKSHEVT